MLKTLKREDELLYMYVLLCYTTLIRPTEIRRMRFRMIDMDNYMIHLPASITKTWQDGHPTLPRWVAQEIKALKIIEKYPPSYFIFGKGFKPGPECPCGLNTANLKHSKILRKGRKQGKIREGVNLSLYSWKYTGGDELAPLLTPLELQKQFRHARIESTMLYLEHRAQSNNKIVNHRPSGMQINKGI